MLSRLGRPMLLGSAWITLACGEPARDVADASTTTLSTGSADSSSSETGTTGVVKKCLEGPMLEVFSEPCEGGTEILQGEDFGPTGLAVCPDGNVHSYGIACCGSNINEGSCQTDEDCGPGFACKCAGDALYRWYAACLPASCRTDADCDGLPCGVSVGACTLAHRLACRGAQDECLSNADCDMDSFQFCLYVEELGHWACEEDMPPGCGP